MQGQYSLRSPAVKRLMREAHELKDPTEQFYAQPLEDNLFEWHFTIRGPGDSEFDGGIYHGRIILPPEYPMKPPSIIMLTPNGRFEVHKKICLSISGHHPESWQPSWSIRTAMLAIIGFMPTHGSGAIGSLDYTPEERKRLARRTKDWKCPNCGRVCDVLLPVTEASKATSQEAKELASQINFQGEKESKNNSEKSKSEEASPAPKPTPSEPSPAPNPNMTGMFSQPGLPPGMQMPMGMTPAMMGAAMGANQPPRFPPQLCPPMFRPPLNQRGTAPPAPGMQPPMFWPPGFMAMMQMQRGGFQPLQQPQQQQQTSTASPGPSSSSSSLSSSTTTVSSAPASTSNPAQNQNQPPAAEKKPVASSQVTTTPATTTAPSASTSQVSSASTASSAGSSQTPAVGETPAQTAAAATAAAAAAATANPQASSPELRQRIVQPQPRVNTTPQPVRLLPPQQQQASSPVILTFMFVIGLLLLALLLRRLYLLYLRDIVGSSADEL